MTYSYLKKILENGNSNGVVTMEKLEVFLLNNRITETQYNELIAMLNN